MSRPEIWLAATAARASPTQASPRVRRSRSHRTSAQALSVVARVKGISNAVEMANSEHEGGSQPQRAGECARRGAEQFRAEREQRERHTDGFGQRYQPGCKCDPAQSSGGKLSGNKAGIVTPFVIAGPPADRRNDGMSEQDGQHRKDLGQRRVLIVECHVVVQHPGEPGGHINRLVARGRVGPRSASPSPRKAAAGRRRPSSGDRRVQPRPTARLATLRSPITGWARRLGHAAHIRRQRRSTQNCGVRQ